MSQFETLTYGALFTALRHLGFEESQNLPTIVFRHPESGAAVQSPHVERGDPVRWRHLSYARQMCDGFGIIDRQGFDLLLNRLAAPSVPTGAAG